MRQLRRRFHYFDTMDDSMGLDRWIAVLYVLVVETFIGDGCFGADFGVDVNSTLYSKNCLHWYELINVVVFLKIIIKLKIIQNMENLLKDLVMEHLLTISIQNLRSCCC